ncbi:hypothetical protein [Mucilaginibacter sp. dw_454]|uniref:hypothetical protein n=1 Tax=Mucilaginibacter sp. dw_454 TaxID=2720079 RepID=UPI001BD61019|nr:hypothetical protein [Mucilaginibacter sp. dw_454]
MHIAYTKLKDNKSRPTQGNTTDNNQLSIRFKAYYTVCNKYSKEITAIQKYLPGWVPPYPAV